jgi:hypothetical protein
LAQPISGAERRRWPRLTVPVPVFVRGVDGQGKEYLDFGTAVNISAGGVLLASRRYLPNGDKVSLEIPPPPFPQEAAKARSLKARVVHVRGSDRCHLCSLAFSKPLAIK